MRRGVAARGEAAGASEPRGAAVAGGGGARKRPGVAAAGAPGGCGPRAGDAGDAGGAGGAGDAYVSAMPAGAQDTARRLLAVVRECAPGTTESVKWGALCVSVPGKPGVVCSLSCCGGKADAAGPPSVLLRLLTCRDNAVAALAGVAGAESLTCVGKAGRGVTVGGGAAFDARLVQRSVERCLAHVRGRSEEAASAECIGYSRTDGDAKKARKR